VHTIYGIEWVPCDTHMCKILDPVSPKGLRPVCKSVLRQLQRGKALEALTFLDGHDRLALDGTESFASKTMHNAFCVQMVHRTGAVTDAPQMLGAALIHLDQRAVLPRMPEPMVHRDGTDKNDCERHATKRLVGTLRQDSPHLTCLMTEDRLSAHAPPIATLQDYDLRSILRVKENAHPYLCQQGKAAAQAGRGTS
jgi:hypothetical protein